MPAGNFPVSRKWQIVLLVAALGMTGGCGSDEGPAATSPLCSNVSETLQNPGSRLDFASLQRTVAALVGSLSLDEKLGQMILADVTFILNSSGRIDFSQISEFHLGGILIDANVVPDGTGTISTNAVDEDVYLNGTMSNWQALSSALMGAARDGNEIPLLIGTDNIHGNQHVVGEILVPHNIGLAAAHDPEIVCATAFFNSHSVLESGLNWGYSPTIAVAHNFQWGRTYETLGSGSDDIVDTVAHYVFGHQATDFRAGLIRGTLATTKHLFGDGATFNGIDEGNVHVANLDAFMDVNLTPYRGGLDASVGSSMISYSGVNTTLPFNVDTSVPMSINPMLMGTYLNGDFLGRPFDGFIVSDFNGIEKAANQGLPTTGTKIPFEDALPLAIHGGIDMIMTNGQQVGISTLGAYIAVLRGLVESGRISMERIDAAVTRILAIKVALGLIRKTGATYSYRYEKGVGDLPHFNQISTRVRDARDARDAAHRTALIAAHESLVLLKNQPAGAGQEVLPIDLDPIRNIVLVGEKILTVQTAHDPVDTLFQDFDNIGVQNGGWTLRWQGFEGNKFWQGENKERSRASSILDALSAARGSRDIELRYPQYASHTDIGEIEARRSEFVSGLAGTDLNRDNTVIIAVLSEVPYAEFMGDINNPACRDTIDDFMNGCLYNLQQFKLNTYLPRQQNETLRVEFSEFDRAVIDAVRSHDASIPLVTILFSGRPMIINSAVDTARAPLDESTAFIAAWLPGTAGGQAIVDALLGEYRFCQGRFSVENGQRVCDAESPNTLPVDWLRSEDQLEGYPVYEASASGFPRLSDPLFDIGYGLATAN